MTRIKPIEASPVGFTIFQGSKPPVGISVIQSGFPNLVLCAEEYQPSAAHFPGVRVHHSPMDDDMLTEPDLRRAKEAARFVTRKVRAQQPVLITCQQGRNRSGLVTALSLYMLTGKSGSSIVNHIKKHRYNSLTNPYFEQYLRSLPPKKMA